MAVQPQTPFKEYTANGTTTVFPLDFDCENKDHLIVMIDDAETDNSTWSLNNKQVTFNAAPSAGKKITLQRNTPYRRDRNYQAYDNSFRPGPVNDDFDWIWWKLQELGVADWLLKNYVDRLHQQQENKINDLKTYVDDRDDELRAYLIEEIRKQGVALDQLDDYYNYLMQRLAQIAVDKGWDASFVVDAGGSTQQDINDFGGAKWRNKAGGYALGATVKLDNGDIVKSTIDGNTNDPNVNMTGWLNIGNVGEVESIADLLSIPNPKNGSRVYVKSYYKADNFALLKPYKGGGQRIYVESRKNENDGAICINGWVLQFEKLYTDQCGCYVDGITDDTENLQRAIDVTSRLKIPLYLSSGVHLVNTTTRDVYNPASPFYVRPYILDNRSNMCIIGDSETTIIKYADGITHKNDWVGDNGSALFCSNPRENLYNLNFIGIVVDQNGINNKQMHIADHVQGNQAITLSTGSNCLVKDCVFKNFSGMQVIYSRNAFDTDDGPNDPDEPFQNLRIINNEFLNCGWLDGQNWNINGIHDHSTIYASGTYQILNNKFTQSVVGMYAGTALELHGEGFISGNYIKSYANAFLSVGQYRDAHNVVIANKVLDCTSFALTDTHTQLPDQKHSNTLELISNYFRQATFYIDQSWFFGNDRSMIKLTGFGGHKHVRVLVRGNTFETDGDYSGRTDDDLAINNAFISTQQFNELIVEGNTITGHKGALYKIGRVTVTGDCSIYSKNNTFRNCGVRGNHLAGNSINYNWNEGALDHGINLKTFNCIGDTFIECSYEYIVSANIEADGLVSPHSVIFDCKFYDSYSPQVYKQFVSGDVKQADSLYYNVVNVKPTNTDIIISDPQDTFRSYNEWGSYIVIKDKQYPIAYKKDGTAQNWSIA